MSPEQKTKLFKEMFAHGFSSVDNVDISRELRADILFESLELGASVPRTHCANCNCTIFIHEAKKIGEKHYCESCAGRIQ